MEEHSSNLWTSIANLKSVVQSPNPRGKAQEAVILRLSRDFSFFEDDIAVFMVRSPGLMGGGLSASISRKSISAAVWQTVSLQTIYLYCHSPFQIDVKIVEKESECLRNSLDSIQNEYNYGRRNISSRTTQLYS